MYLHYMRAFRVLAIFCIVAGHTVDAFEWSNQDGIERLLRIFISNGSCFFIFIAGYLFQHLSNKYDTITYYKAKISHVVLPYLLMSLPAIFTFTFVMERESVWAGFYDQPVWIQVGWFYATGTHLAPLWFVPMISIFYVLAPVLIREDRSRRLYYFLPVSIALSLLVARGGPVQSFVHFFSAYLIGMACSHFKGMLQPVFTKLAFLLPMLTLSVLAGLIEYELNDGTMTAWNYSQKVFGSLFLLGLLSRFNEWLTSDFLKILADTSFVVFFLHSYVITAIKIICMQEFGSLPSGSFVMVLLASCAVLALCVLMVQVIKKLTGRRSRQVIGC